MKLKRILAASLAAVALLAFAGCQDEEGPNRDTEQVEPMEGLIEFNPMYIGEALDTTEHEFKTSDFHIMAAFAGEQRSRLVTEGFKITKVERASGYFVVTIAYGGIENDCYVPINIDFFGDSAN